ncbi:NAD-dependent epimerase/dehydratase family protein [Microbacterium tenebrionis]|uniref:NAD-dependent epimerase/dehydratase family protein n=1 Tax=Microbacterium tenebrionis TaxID=2830665 RepID=UPI0015897C28|nr:NAD-dependent epimerase/dehydratase family protein [Microbacterium ihumii]
MPDVLILGGTGWLSGRIARRWADAGAQVTCLARGGRPAPDGTALVRGDRDDPATYGQLDRDWDEVVDISSRADHVRTAVSALGHRAAHWTYVSSMSVYADADVDDADETARLGEPAADGDEYDYAAQKVAAEAAVRALGGRIHIIRPGLIVGPGDPSDRFGYWAAAFARAGSEAVLVPDGTGRSVQVIDVDDLAGFAANADLIGIRNAIGDPHPFDDVLGLFRVAAGHTGRTVVAADDWLESHEVQPWMGERSLPLWLPRDWSGFMTRSNAAYAAAGGTRTPLEKVIGRVLDDERARGLDRSRRAGLTRDDERALLAELPS